MADELDRMRWRCRRGMHELDALLQAFLEHGFEALDAADKARFEALLELPDPSLYTYLVGHDVPRDADTARLVEKIRQSLEPRA